MKGLPRIEMDALHHGENWLPRPTFEEEVAAFAEQPRWVTEWQYTNKLGTLLTGKADTVLWLDYPRTLVMRRVIVRTVRRRVRREVLWNGNTEGPLWTVLRDPDHIVRWAWRTHHKAADRVRELLEWRGDEVAVVRFTGRRHLDRWLRNLR
ncbi:P-loop NTPase family protein [Hamadaea tsunoensis]|uniref:hypothetical protein n=1 Tax=Hamadaea tsunoensis TaxID=53368 RepID=UPI001B7FEEB1|nr:hypothetical protein [Hamadaea tsunoensis]